MGLFTKRGKTHVELDPETGERKLIHEEEAHGVAYIKEKLRREPEYKELTYEEQFKPRVHPWQTERGKRLVSDAKAGLKKVDKKIVQYNRRSNIMNPSRTRRTVHPMIGFGFNPPSSRNVNSFGTLFDTGIPKPREKKKSSTKYAIVGGKAYPIAGSGKKKSKKKKRHTKPEFYDPFKSWRW